MPSLRLEMPSTVPARLGAFATVLLLAAAGGWTAGEAVGPITIPPPDSVAVHDHGHDHLESP